MLIPICKSWHHLSATNYRKFRSCRFVRPKDYTWRISKFLRVIRCIIRCSFIFRNTYWIISVIVVMCSRSRSRNSLLLHSLPCLHKVRAENAQSKRSRRGMPKWHSKCFEFECVISTHAVFVEITIVSYEWPLAASKPGPKGAPMNEIHNELIRKP